MLRQSVVRGAGRVSATPGASIDRHAAHLVVVFVAGGRRSMVGVSDAAGRQDEPPHGIALLPGDLSEDQLSAAPVLMSIDALLIEELSEDEDEAFAAALAS